MSRIKEVDLTFSHFLFEGSLRKCKGSARRIQGENECRSEETRKIRYGRGERL